MVKKSLFFYQKINATYSIKYTFVSKYTPWLIQKLNNPLTQPNKSLQQPPSISPKNPKRVAAGKAIAERTKQAREAQKKKLAEADVIIANNQLKKAEAAAAAEPPTKNVLTTTQWLSVISIFISVVGIYYKREEIKKVLTKNPPQAPPPSPVDVAPQRKGGIRPMD